MTQNPGPAAGPAPTASGLDRFFDWLRTVDLRRDGEEKWLAGIASGTANRLGVDPIVIRAAFVLLALLGGLGITVYLIAWAFVPNDRDEVIAERAVRQGYVPGIILLVVVALSLVSGPGMSGDHSGVWVWWVALPVVLVVWLVTRHRDRHDVTATGRSAMAYAAPPAAPGAAPAATAGPTTVTLPVGGPPQSPTPPVPPAARRPRPPRPPRPPRRRGAGFVGAVLVSGVALATYGATMWLHDANHWSGSGETIALGAALGVFGLALVGLGLAGFRAGLTAFIAVLLAFATWTSSVVPNLHLAGGMGDRVWRPAATDTAHRYRLGVGQAELDLSNLPDNPASPRRIDAGLGVGELRIRIPANLTVQVVSDVGAGDVSRATLDPGADPADPDALFGSTTSTRDGRRISTTETFGSGTPDVVVDAHVGLGQILIGKE